MAEQQLLNLLLCLWADDVTLRIRDELSAAISALMVPIAVMDVTVFDGQLGKVVRTRRRISVHSGR